MFVQSVLMTILSLEDFFNYGIPNISWRIFEIKIILNTRIVTCVCRHG